MRKPSHTRTNNQIPLDDLSPDRRAVAFQVRRLIRRGHEWFAAGSPNALGAADLEGAGFIRTRAGYVHGLPVIIIIGGIR